MLTVRSVSAAQNPFLRGLCHCRVLMRFNKRFVSCALINKLLRHHKTPLLFRLRLGGLRFPRGARPGAHYLGKEIKRKARVGER